MASRGPRRPPQGEDVGGGVLRALIGVVTCNTMRAHGRDLLRHAASIRAVHHDTDVAFRRPRVATWTHSREESPGRRWRAKSRTCAALLESAARLSLRESPPCRRRGDGPTSSVGLRRRRRESRGFGGAAARGGWRPWGFGRDLSPAEGVAARGGITRARRHDSPLISIVLPPLNGSMDSRR